MNFLERLEQMRRDNQGREAEEAEAWKSNVAEAKRKGEEEMRMLAAEAAARQKESARRFTTVPEHREFAIQIREESGVELLVARLGEILEKDNVGKANLNQQRDNFYMVNHLGAPIDIDNVNSAVDVVTWREPRGVSGIVWPNRALAVESHPSGQILFHGARREDIEHRQWKSDAGVLSEALERAFNIPARRYRDEWDLDQVVRRSSGSGQYIPLAPRTRSWPGM